MRVGIVIGQPQALDPGARGDAAVQHQRRGARRRRTRRSRTRTSCPATRPRCGSRGSGCMRPAAGSASSTGRARPTTCWCASARRRRSSRRMAARTGPRPRPVEGSDDARVHPDHGRHPRAHRRGDRGARVGRGGRRPMSRSQHEQAREAGAPAAFDRRTTETQIRGRAGRSTARGATTSAPASASSTTCSSCSRATAAST